MKDVGVMWRQCHSVAVANDPVRRLQKSPHLALLADALTKVPAHGDDLARFRDRRSQLHRRERNAAPALETPHEIGAYGHEVRDESFDGELWRRSSNRLHRIADVHTSSLRNSPTRLSS